MLATVYKKLKICNKALLHAEKSVSIYQDLSYLDLEYLFTKELVRKIKWRIKKTKNLKMIYRKNKYCKDKVE